MKQIAATSGPTNIGLLSVGSYRPERVVTNDEICENIDSSDEWIYSRTGIKTRRFAARDESAASMATEAGRRGHRQAPHSTASDIDCVIVATSTHLLQTPACAPSVAAALGAAGVPAFDISAGVRRIRLRARRRGRHDPRRDRRQGAGPRLGETVPHHRHARPRQLLHLRRRRGRSGGGRDTRTKASDRPSAGSDGEQADAIRQDIDWITSAQNPSGPRPFVRLEGRAVFRWAAFEMGDVGRQAHGRGGSRTRSDRRVRPSPSQ